MYKCVDFMAQLPNKDEEMALDPAGASFQWLSFKTGFRHTFFSFCTVLMVEPSTTVYAKQEIYFHFCCDKMKPGACTCFTTELYPARFGIATYL